MKKTFFILITIFLVLSACTSQQESKKLFEEKCIQCHSLEKPLHHIGLSPLDLAVSNIEWLVNQHRIKRIYKRVSFVCEMFSKNLLYQRGF